MFRSSAPRTLLRSLNASPKLSTTAPAFRSQLCTLATRRPALSALARPLAMQMRLATTKGPMDTIDKATEQALAKKKLPVDPENVSTESSVHPVFGEVGGEAKHDDTDMMAGMRSDMQTIKDTFSLEEVPRQAYYIGLAGVLPYVATSLSTVYCAWEVNYAAAAGTGFMMDGKTAELLLHVLEPIQVGYGAAIISFLGAIHWGLEFAKYGGEHGYRRYQIGVWNTALASLTVLLPVESALISQFLLFTFSYYRDARASKQGWAPQWYGVYRFVLTFIVGSAIVVSLIGRGNITQDIGRPSGPAQRVRELRAHQTELEENEEEQRRKFLASKDEEEEEEEEGGEEEGGDEEEKKDDEE